MSRALFVDVDDTLLLPGPTSRWMWRLAKFFQRRGRAGQRLNPRVMELLRQYDRVILVTSRDVADQSDTIAHLRAAGFEPSAVKFCPRKQLFSDWKASVIAASAEGGAVDWVDDAFDQETILTLATGPSRVSVRAFPPPTGTAGPSRTASEPISL